MFSKRVLCLLPVSMILLGAEDQTWKDKQIANWSVEDARQVLTDSPWVKTVTPSFNKSAGDGERRSGGGMGRGGGISIGGIGIGLPGMGGMGRRGGGGGGGGGYPGRGGPGGTNGGPDTSSGPAPALRLRWESALPVREAELTVKDENAPIVDEDHYAIAVYDFPSRFGNGDPRNLTDELRKQAAIKREGKKDFKPTSVEVLEKDAGPVIVYLFPRSTEITKGDKRIEFDAQIGRLKLSEAFYVDDMTYQGKLEL